jgi:hypothetical protein
MFDFDTGIEDIGSTMPHLDDGDGDHSVFLSSDLTSRLEFPLLALKKGMENRQDDHPITAWMTSAQSPKIQNRQKCYISKTPKEKPFHDPSRTAISTPRLGIAPAPEPISTLIASRLLLVPSHTTPGTRPSPERRDPAG